MSGRDAEVRMHAAQAYNRSLSPETRRHLRAILRLLPDDGQLVECPTCGRVGLAERVVEHDC